jgi:aromatic-amino-acid transaminase
VALAISATPEASGVTKANLATLNRLNFSFPPDHGAKVVSIILNDAELRADWMAELEDMRQDMLTLRTGLADALRRETNSDRFDFIADHRGMFSRLGLGPDQVAALRNDHGIYMVGDSRVNIAGLPREGLDRIARAMVATAG